ncbi:MAG TPA: hypothetical protein VKV40_10885 [Ktedonobacteraceae bacterium]|nr:hypothetical protein [Ktedonobacteraceae bacterium]
MKEIGVLLLTWIVLAVLLMLSYGMLFFWLLRPTLARLTRRIRGIANRCLCCAWCWRVLRLPFPSHWSSSICYYHQWRLRTQLAARRHRNERLVRGTILEARP